MRFRSDAQRKAVMSQLRNSGFVKFKSPSEKQNYISQRQKLIDEERKEIMGIPRRFPTYTLETASQRGTIRKAKAEIEIAKLGYKEPKEKGLRSFIPTRKSDMRDEMIERFKPKRRKVYS